MATREHGGTASTYGQRVYLEWEKTETDDTYTISTKVGLQAYMADISMTMLSRPYCSVESNLKPVNQTYRYFEASKDLPFSLSRGSYALFLARTFRFKKTHSAQTVKLNAMSIMEWFHFGSYLRWYDDGSETGYYKTTTETNSVFLKSFSVPAKTNYTLTFEKNGGTGTNFTKTKWHGETLTLPTNPFTRVGYRFVGWGTSSSGTATYSENGAYDGNANRTLYAIWQSTYVAPVISNLTATRASYTDGIWSDYDEGEKLHVKFNYTIGTEDGNNLPQTFKVGYKKSSVSSYTYVTVTGTDGLVDQFVDVQIDSADSYDIQAVIEVGQQTGGGPTHSNVTRKTYISPIYFCIDVAPDGSGIAFGKPSARTGFECNMDAVFYGDITDGNGSALNINATLTVVASGTDLTTLDYGIYALRSSDYTNPPHTGSVIGRLVVRKSADDSHYKILDYMSYDGSQYIGTFAYDGSFKGWTKQPTRAEVDAIKRYEIGTVSTSSATTIASGGYATITVNAAKTGYTPVGMLTVNKSGNNQGRSFVSNWYFSGNDLKVGVYNTASAQAEISLTATVLYVKS